MYPYNALYGLYLPPPITFVLRPMAKQEKPKNIDLIENPEAVAEVTLNRIETFVQNNQRPLMISLIAVVVIALGVFGVNRYIIEPNEVEAQEALALAVRAYEADSLDAALNGSGAQLGFNDIADEWSSTDAGTLAHYYAGLSYMGLGQYESAIEAFDQYELNSEVLGSVALSAIGDAFANIDQAEEAEEYYSKAANAEELDYLTPFHLYKAGVAAEVTKDYKRALKHYKRIKKEYPTSEFATNIDALIGFCEAKLAAE